MSASNGSAIQAPAVEVRLQHGNPPLIIHMRYADSHLANFMRDLVVKMATKESSPARVVKMAEAIVDETYRKMLERQWVVEVPPISDLTMMANHEHQHAA